MSIVSTSLAPAVAPAVSAVSNNQSNGAAARGISGSSSSANAQATLASQSPAFVLSLSADSKNRATSSGEGRRVDGSGSKDDAKSARAKQEDQNGGQQKTLNVAA